VRRSRVVFALLLAGLVFVGGGSSAVQSSTDWPGFHHDKRHTGVSTDTAIGASNVASLGVDWVANTGSPAYTSPAVAFNAQLGKTLVYIGNQSGTLTAYDANTGDRVWYFKAPSTIQSSPTVSGKYLYVGASDHKLYALNAATGQVACSFDTGGVISSSPLVVNPDGTGLVVYFGDNGLTGNDDGGDEWAINAVDPNPAANCSVKWKFTGFNSSLSGSWSPPAFGTDSTGRRLVVFGSSDPDDAVYALDARTGEKVWRFQAGQGSDTDVGAGPTISVPGPNGFPDGAVYVASKYREFYAIDLKTGALDWKFSIRDDSPASGGAPRSTAALLGHNVYFGYGAGVYDLDARTGAKVWKTEDFGPSIPEVISSPAISGASGNQVLFVGDTGTAGTFRAYSLTGHQLWSYDSGSFVYGSPAIANGHMYIASSNGLLYAFKVGGGVSGKPSATISSPSDGSTVTNDGSPIQISGTSSDDTGVSRVYVAVKDTASGRWWDPDKQVWSPVFQQMPATLANPGGTSTGWTASLPAPTDGGVFLVQADAVDTDGQHDPNLPSVKFTLTSLSNPPDTTIGAPTLRQIFYPPCCDANGLFFMPYYVTVSGNATDTQGAHPGVMQVRVSVRNIEHGEYWCGEGGCPGEPGVFWQPAFTSVLATLDSPGATSTGWSTRFLIYDHEHTYRIVAWATDNDGTDDPTRAQVNKVCVNWPTDNRCL
jgi:outer membrane protein assembly factor BamB